MLPQKPPRPLRSSIFPSFLRDSARADLARIRRLCDEAREQLSRRFDLRAFHQQVLEQGAILLGILRRQIELWISQVKDDTSPVTR
jgi:hypothetical protein